MEYTQQPKDEQKAWLIDQIRNLETQHFQQEQFAAMAEAAADLPEPDEADQSVEAQQARSMRESYTTQATQHRMAVLEAERRINAARAALTALGGSLDEEKKPKRQR